MRGHACALGLAIMSSLIGGGVAAADLRLPSLFSDHMVLQQESVVSVWGWSAPGARVAVAPGWGNATVTATADAAGRWLARVETPPAGGPFEIRITSGDDTRILEDVLIGEVWVASGQSNMEWAFANGVVNGEAEVAAAHYPHLRLFEVEHRIAAAPAEDVAGRWQRCDPNTVRNFSAVAYFFGREVIRRENVPVGIIGTYWGGTPVEAWMSARALGVFDEFTDGLRMLAQEAQEPGTLARAEARAVREWWAAIERVDEGSQGVGWTARDLDDGAWPTMRVPGSWQDTPLADFDGVVWFRTRFDAPAAWEGRELILELGPIDDFDRTWINETVVGQTEEMGRWATPRRYTVPVGVARGGENTLAVRVVDWTSDGGLKGQPGDLRIYPVDAPGEALALAGEWHYRLGATMAELPAMPLMGGLHQNRASVLFNGMVAPLVPYGIRGVIWYQGESNWQRPEQYGRLFPAMIEDWRKQWSGPDMPFFFAQIAPFDYRDDTGRVALLREAQRRTQRVPHTGMVVTLDIGDVRDIHPRNKQEVGRRFALLALAEVYGQTDLPSRGPELTGCKPEGEALRLTFDHVGLGLVGIDDSAGFEVAGADGVYHLAQAEIDGASVVLRSASVQAPVSARYAWDDVATATLFNSAGLPASSFCTADVFEDDAARE